MTRSARWPSLLLSTLLLACALPARAATPAPAADAATAKPPVPLLWKVSRGGHALYLLGSFHVLRPGDYPLSPAVDQAFGDAESLLFEMAPAALESPTLALEMGQAALRGDGRSLSATLPADTRRKLEAWLQRKGATLAQAGLPAAALERFEPWYVGLLVGMLDMGELGLDPALGLDRHLGDTAGAAGKATAGLETAAQQIAFLDGMDAAEQLQFLDESLAESLAGNDEVERLHALWRAGDAAGLWNALAVDMRRDYPRLYARINVARNDAWLPRLVERLQAPGEDDTLVVVGALHLLGSDGLVEKLRARGYAVERLGAPR